MIELEDMGGKVRGVVFSRTYEELKEYLVEDSVIFVEARVDRSRDVPTLVVNTIIPLERAEERLAVRAVLNLSMTGVDETKLEQLQNLAAQNQGDARLFFRLDSPEGRVDIRAGERYNLRPTRRLVEEVNALFGEGALTLGGRRSNRN